MALRVPQTAAPRSSRRGVSPAWLLILAVTTTLTVPKVSALPSFGSRIPNGEIVPCPPSPSDAAADAAATDPNRSDCLDGYCRGLGHEDCKGGTSGLSTQSLSPFGLDLRDSDYEWTPELCQADSDGDGFTNGEELGDPCCVWTFAWASGGRGVAPYTQAFVPSHPGDADRVLPVDYVRPVCGTDDTTPPGQGAAAEDSNNNGGDDNDNSAGMGMGMGIAGYNDGEERGSFEFRIKDFPIPRVTTTYVDFVFNLPEDLPDVVHIVYGEALNSQPKHLHHFVVQGCTTRLPEDQVGVPLDSVPTECNVPVGGFSGWAPGVTMWEVPKNAGVPIGKGFGVQALSINVHYTDGDAPYLDEGEHAIATDGIRIHYTPDLRPRTMTNSPVIQVGFGPRDMVVEPSKPRAFMTRTCTVESRCQDMSDTMMNTVGSTALSDPTLTCTSGAQKFFCNFSELFQLACPASCGLCEEGSSRNPDAYQAIGVSYHAHLLGKEMYTTLIPHDDPEARIDLKSRNIWTYEDQTPYQLDNVMIRPGDKIQTTCVFDSSGRSDATQFDLATYDEMCLNTIAVIFDTPNLEGDGASSGLSAANEMYLRGFKCDTSEGGDIWLGELGFDEDARRILDDHPLTEATCSFPTGLWIFDGVPSQEKRCYGEIVTDDDYGICAQVSGSFFNPRASAGHTCQGGTLSEKDSNDGTTQEQCLDGGGTWYEYNCREAQQYLNSGSSVNGFEDVEMKQYLREYWWAPKCCLGGDDVDSGDGNGDGGDAGNVVDIGDGDSGEDLMNGSEDTETEAETASTAASSAAILTTGGGAFFPFGFGGLLLVNLVAAFL